MEIQITPEEVNNYIKDSILKSTVGQTVSLSIKKEIEKLFSSYDSPIKKFVEEHLKQMVKEYMERQDIKPLMIEAIEKNLTPQVISEIVSQGLYQLNKSIKERDSY